jgi:sialate O-acetylesterase
MSSPTTRFATATVGLLLVLTDVQATELVLPAMFTDHLILQREQAVPIWGWSDAATEVTVRFAGQTKQAIADETGLWLVKLDSMKADGQSQTMTVSANEAKREIRDVLVGEVWLASGQSNMHYNFAQRILEQEQVLAQPEDSWIRQFTVVRNDKLQSPRELAGRWRTANRENLTASRTDGDSAVAYFFSRLLREKLNCPVGVLHASVGATPIQSWMAGGSFYQTMIQHLAPYSIRGVIWYQGESNVQRSQSEIYAELLSQHVAGWRSLWNQGDFPFFYVQLAPHCYSQKRAGPTKDKPVGPLELPLFWEAQSLAGRQIPQSGMVIIHDSITDLDNIHPPNKRVPGERLAALALAKTYGQRLIPYEGPVYRDLRIEGNSIRLMFDFAGSGLATRDRQAPNLFEIAGEDREFFPAEAMIEADSLLVSHPSVAQPVAVRFAWHEEARPNLINREGLPACPFRTDDWPLKPSPSNHSLP